MANPTALNEVVQRARAARERTGHWPGSHAEALCNEVERLQKELNGFKPMTQEELREHARAVSMEGQPMGDPHPCDLSRAGFDPLTGKALTSKERVITARQLEAALYKLQIDAEVVETAHSLARRIFEAVPPDETTAERVCNCVPQIVRTWKYCTDCGGLIPSAEKSNCSPSTSTDGGAPPSRSPTSSVECPKCRTELAFEGDECGLCKEEVQ